MFRSGPVMAWNVFKFCTPLRGLGSIMIVLVLGVVGVTYYALVIANYGSGLATGGLDSLIALVILILFHCLLAMLLWSYFSVVFTDPGCVPLNWREILDEERGDTDPLTSTEFPVDSKNGRIRFCRKCNNLKPPRCHHYSISIKRYLGLQGLWPLPFLPSFMIYVFLPMLNLAFVLSVMGFLIMRISLVTANTTTIEAYEKKTTPKWHYDLGWKRNFEQVFGMDKMYWFISAYSKEDLRRMPALQGLEYP